MFRLKYTLNLFFGVPTILIDGYIRFVISNRNKTIRNKLIPRDITLLCANYIGIVGTRDKLKIKLKEINDEIDNINKCKQELSICTRLNEKENIYQTINQIMGKELIKLMQISLNNEKDRILQYNHNIDANNMTVIEFNNLSLQFKLCIEKFQSSLNNLCQMMEKYHIRKIHLLMYDSNEPQINTVDELIEILNDCDNDYDRFKAGYLIPSDCQWAGMSMNHLIQRLDECECEWEMIRHISHYINQLNDIYNEITNITDMDLNLNRMEKYGQAKYIIDYQKRNSYCKCVIL